MIIAYNNGSTAGNVATDVSAANPLPVTGSGGGGEVPVNLNQIEGAALATSPTGTVPVFDVSSAGDISPTGSTITEGGSSQQLLAANANRKYLFIQNQSIGVLAINAGAAASLTEGSGSLFLAAATSATSGNGGYYEPLCVPTDAINIIGATTGQAFTVWEV